MLIKKFKAEKYCNCFVVATEKAAVVIDPGVYSEELLDFFAADQRQLLILLTHRHFDHIGAAQQLRNETGAPIVIGQGDADALLDPDATLATRFNQPIGPFTADILLDEEETLRLGDLTIRAIPTPGHTAGGMCFLIGEHLFSGDILLPDKPAITRFPTGDPEAYLQTLRTLQTLNPDTLVYPGHGETTTLGYIYDNVVGSLLKQSAVVGSE